jgi:hypothetical protein
MWVASPIFTEVTLRYNPSQRQSRRDERPFRMTRGKIESAKRLLGDRMPPCEVANPLGGSLPMLDREVPVSSLHAPSGADAWES